MEDKKVNTYEISFLTNLPEDAELVKKHLAKQKVEIVTEGPVSQIKLAYPVKKQTSAYFGYIHFKAEAGTIAGLNYDLGLDKNVLRFLIITPPAEKPKPRLESPRPTTKKASGANDLSNEALEAKLAALQNNA